MPTLSIALATFNGEQHLAAQLDSLVQQTVLPNELVVSDDGSTDNTVEIIEAFTTTSPFPVRLHRNAKQAGYKSNFMRLASLCSSELIAFCDQDDVWKSEKVEIAVHAFSDPENLLFWHNADIINNACEVVGTIGPLAGSQVFLPLSSDPRLYSLGFTQVFRSSLICMSYLWLKSCETLADNEKIAHDQWFFFLASVFGKIVYSPKSLVSYRQHDSNVFGWRSPVHIGAIKSFLSVPESSLLYWERSFSLRAEILESAVGHLSGTWKERAVLGASSYSRLRGYYRDRLCLYSSRRPLRRVMAFASLLRARAYRLRRPRAIWGFSLKALAKDFVVALILQRRTRSLPE